MSLATTADRAIATALPQAAEGLAVEVLTGTAALRRHMPDIRRLAQTAHTFVVFQSTDIVAGWVRAVVDEDGRLATVVVRQGRGIVAVIPVELRRRGGIMTARLAGTPIGQYDEVLIDPAADPARVVAAAWAALRQTSGVDVIMLGRVRRDSALWAACAGAIRLGQPDEAPYADLGDHSGGDAFVATLKDRVRRQLAKRRRQLADLGPCRFDHPATPEEAADWMRFALTMKRDWLTRTGRVSRAFASPSTSDFLVEAARAGYGPADRPVPPGGARLLMSRLTVDGRPAALEAGFLCGSSYHLYLGAFANELARFGAGNVLTEAVLRACADAGVRYYDMLAPDSRSKREWATGSVTVTDLAVPLSGVGRLAVNVVHRALLPAARRVFYRLPLPVRTALADRLLAR